MYELKLNKKNKRIRKSKCSGKIIAAAELSEDINKKISKYSEGVSAVLLTSIVLVNGISVFFRYVVDSPLGWTEEFLRYAIVWAVYLVVGSTVYRGEDMVIRLFESLNNKTINMIIIVLSAISTILLTIVIFIFGIPLVISNLSQLSPTMQLPMTIPYSAVLVGFFILSVQTVLSVISKIK
ncbi:membrane hypothetical protein [Vibrio nigripulchritudo SOn1]|uniref:TRAP transporter small permease protein n=1 Tax=Vibrio nigripulchritudo SOn1 TaxID=1238450 RepID=A0AAV2VZP5_9VIBR|nr:TRAP transporter small permease [Vibrio nigripulchritudo]CCO50202.1 membrane hypothetical protein [Vibrio nigripulchritudo SOn1]